MEMHSLGPVNKVCPPVISEQTLIYFVAFCSNRGLRHDTIKQYLYGVLYFYLKHNSYTPLITPAKLCQLQLVLRGVKKSQCNVVKPRLPITFNILLDIIAGLRKGFIGQYNSGMLAAACSMAFFGVYTVANSQSLPVDLIHPILSL